jgi:hypothetical protein
MARIDEYLLSQVAAFQQRSISSVLDYILGTIFVECAYDIQTVSISGSPTGGTFTLTGGPLGGSTITLPWNATPAQVQVLINTTLSNTGSACVCQGTVLPAGSVQVIWTGTLTQQPQGLVTASGSGLSGGSGPAATATHTVVGVAQDAHPLHLAFANKVLAAPVAYMPILAQALASNAAIQTDYLTGQSSGSGVEAQITDAHLDAGVAAQYNLWSGAY